MNDTGHAKKPASGKRRIGRPRRLTIEQIVDAALAIGINKMTMQEVADHLGVGKPLLYNYVSSREELARMARAQATRKVGMPEDTGQCWATWILQYAAAVFDILTAEGDLLEAWIEGGSQPAVDVGSVIMWVEVLGRRGFSGTEALQLRSAVSHLVIGAAAANKHRLALRKGGRTYEEGVQAAFAQLSRQQVDTLSPYIEILSRDIEPGSWEFALYLLLRGVSQSRHLVGAPVQALPFSEIEAPQS